MFRVLGIYNFGQSMKKSKVFKNQAQKRSSTQKGALVENGGIRWVGASNLHQCTEVRSDKILSDDFF